MARLSAASQDLREGVAACQHAFDGLAARVAGARQVAAALEQSADRLLEASGAARNLS